MRELVGKIYRNENGIEEIERITKNYINLWDIKLINLSDGIDSCRYGYQLSCPHCNKSKYYYFKTEDIRDRCVKRIQSGSANAFTYCGKCGHKNLI